MVHRLGEVRGVVETHQPLDEFLEQFLEPGDLAGDQRGQELAHPSVHPVGFAGEDTFTYTAQDDQGGSGHAQVTVTVTSTSGKDYYVATDGDDTNPGTADEPFATLNGAQAAIRSIKTASG